MVCALGRYDFVDIIYWVKEVPFVLIFDCCITNYYKFNGSEQHAFIISVSMGQGCGHSLAGSFAQILTGCNQSAVSSGGSSREGSLFLSSFRLLTEFISSYDWEFWHLTGYCLPSAARGLPPTVPCHRPFPWAVHSISICFFKVSRRLSQSTKTVSSVTKPNYRKDISLPLPYSIG